MHKGFVYLWDMIAQTGFSFRVGKRDPLKADRPSDTIPLGADLSEGDQVGLGMDYLIAPSIQSASTYEEGQLRSIGRGSV